MAPRALWRTKARGAGTSVETKCGHRTPCPLRRASLAPPSSTPALESGLWTYPDSESFMLMLVLNEAPKILDVVKLLGEWHRGIVALHHLNEVNLLGALDESHYRIVFLPELPPSFRAMLPLYFEYKAVAISGDEPIRNHVARPTIVSEIDLRSDSIAGTKLVVQD